MRKKKRNKEIEKANKAAQKAKIALDEQLEKLSKLDEDKKLEEIAALKAEKEKLEILKAAQDEDEFDGWKEKKARKKDKKKTSDEVKIKVKDERKDNKAGEDTETKRKKYNALYTKKSKFHLSYWITWYKDKYRSSRTILINMELLNGMHDTFLIVDKNGGFKYRKGKYIFDNDAKYYNINAKLWCYDYHEQFTLPIKRVIPINRIKSTLEASNISEVEFATSPSTLERFIIGKIAEGIMRGAEIDVTLKRLTVLAIITVLVVIAHLLLFAQKSGIFAQINMPF